MGLTTGFTVLTAQRFGAGVCASNNAAWAGAAIFLLICYRFIMKKMENWS